MEPERCGNCRFWRRYRWRNAAGQFVDEAYGSCRRRAPAAGTDRLWAKPGENEWCGDYLPVVSNDADTVAVALATAVLRNDMTAARALVDKLQEIWNGRV